MNLSQERIDEFKVIYEKEYGKEISDAEASDMAHRLASFAEICYDSWRTDHLRKRKLKEHPKGYHLEDSESYSCRICGCTVKNETTWWDLLGIKCMLCQQAVWDGILPSFVFKHHNSFYKFWELKKTFGINTQAAKKLVREEKLKARIVLTENGAPYEYLFLKKENPHLVAYERAHKYMNKTCKCPDPECSFCYSTVCLQKDCAVHSLDRKIEPRTNLITKLQKEAEESLGRSVNEELGEHIQKYNRESAEKNQKYIVMLQESL